jgi:nucleoid-associated protein EbfC
MNLSDLAKMKDMMGQAQQMQDQMEHKLVETVVEASSGGGVVTARMNGKKELLKLTIDPSVLASNSATDIELLEDLITAAINECGRRADEAMKSGVQGMMGNVLGGLNLPDLT